MKMNNDNTMVMMTRKTNKGERIYPGSSTKPVAVAEENLEEGDIGVIDSSKMYPIMYKDSMLLLPGLKKNLTREI